MVEATQVCISACIMVQMHKLMHLQGRCMEWVVWREYHELLTGIARDPDFSDFSLQLHSVASEGLVIFGI